MISIEKNGNNDDCAISVSIKKSEIRFHSKNYCSDEHIDYQIKNFCEFLKSFSFGPSDAKFTLIFGEDVPTSKIRPPNIYFERQQSGKFIVKASLMQKIPGISNDICDKCELFFGADLASIDKFALELKLFNKLDLSVATLETFDPFY